MHSASPPNDCVEVPHALSDCKSNHLRVQVLPVPAPEPDRKQKALVMRTDPKLCVAEWSWMAWLRPESEDGLMESWILFADSTSVTASSNTQISAANSCMCLGQLYVTAEPGLRAEEWTHVMVCFENGRLWVLFNVMYQSREL